MLCISPRSAVTVYVIDTAAINSIADIQNSELNIYPNPADDYLTVETKGGGQFVAEIYDVKGTPVFGEESSSPARLNISHLSPGVYFLKLRYRDGSQSVAKFVKSESR